MSWVMDLSVALPVTLAWTSVSLEPASEDDTEPSLATLEKSHQAVAGPGSYGMPLTALCQLACIQEALLTGLHTPGGRG